MRILLSIAVLGLLMLPAQAQSLPEWAYPVNPPPKPTDDVVQKHLAGSTKAYTQTQIDDGFNPPDWYPQDHPAMPEVVARGRQAANARACALCHLTSGGGHPESALIAGLPAGYITRQMAEFKSGARKGARAVAMLPIAKGLNEEDFKAAAEYFASLKAPVWYKVVETDTVPKSYLGNGAMRFPDEHGGSEPIGNRIIELPVDKEQVELRNPRASFISYVPVGSVAKGEALVTTGGGGKTLPCAICHGVGLKGLGDVPNIAGRSPGNIARQIYYFQTGDRGGPSAALMKGVVEKLTADDVVAISAYVASLDPQ